MPTVSWLDLTCVFVLAWLALSGLRGARARAALLGYGALVGLYVGARALGLELTAWSLRAAMVLGAVLLLLVFQEDLRRLLERLASPRASARAGRSEEGVETVTRAVAHLARERIGALIVVPGKDPIDALVDGLVELDGKVSFPLLLSIFDSHSPGHDGAVVWDGGDRVRAFAGHLPLSTNAAVLGPKGTRHAAALGISERCDSLAVAVSEERGTIHLARGGKLAQVDPERLADALRRHTGLAPDRRPAHREALTLAWRTLAAAAVTGLVWIAAGPGAAVDTRVLAAAVHLRDVPEGWEVDVDPPVVEVTVRGTRPQLLMLQETDVSVTLDGAPVARGYRRARVTAADVTVPEGLEVVDVETSRVRLDARRVSDGETPRGD